MSIRSASVLLLSALACTVVAQAQTSTTSGAIRGTVKSKAGGVVASASLTLRNVETGLTRTTATNASGEYHFAFLPVGPYELTVTAPGLKTAKDSSLRVGLGQTAFQNFSLDKVEASAVVVVMAEAANLDAAQINTQSSISQELIDAIPVNGRNFTDLVQLTPGAAVGNTSYYTTVEGARGIQNNLQIDGGSYNSKFNGEQRGGTRIPFTFGQDSIKELQVITNSFDAQYGDAVGAIINAVTKTGTNETHGTAFMLFRPNSLVAKVKPVPYDPNAPNGVNSDEARTRSYQTLQLGMNLGGPIIKDKLHYFVNVEMARLREDSVPLFGDTTAASTTFFAPGTGMGALLVTMPGRTLADENHRAWTDEQKNLVVMGRLDWDINQDHRATLRLNSQNYQGLNDIYAGVRHNDTAESGNSTMKFTSLSTVLELNSILSSSLLNEARLQLSSEKRPTTPNSTISSPVRINKVGTVYDINAGQYYIDPRTTDETTTQIQDNLTYMTGDWVLKGGVDLQFIDMKNRYLPNGNGSWVFPTFTVAQAWFNQGAAATLSGVTYTQGDSPTNGVSDFSEKYLAGYIQAQNGSLLNKRLLLSVGLRYTTEIWSSNPNPNAKLQGLDRAPNDKTLDPRFGFTLDLFGNAKTVIRGGYGWFSVSNPGQTTSGAIMNNGINLVSYYVTASANPAFFEPGGLLSASQRWSGPLTGQGSLTPIPLSTLRTDPNLKLDTIVPTIIDPNAKMTQARAASLGVEQDLGNGFTVGARVTYKKFLNLQYAVNINLAQMAPGSTTTVDPNAIYNDGYPTTWNRFSTAARPGRAIVRGRALDLSGFGDVILSKYDGEGRYRSLVLEAGRKPGSGWGFKSSLTFAKAEDNNSNERATLTSTNALTENPADPLGSWALSDNDHAFRATLAWFAPTFYGVRVSGITTYTTGRPWNGVYYADQNGDGKYIDTVNGRNSHRQPSEKRFDLRIAREFRVTRGFSLEGTIDVYNAFNWANQYTRQTTYTTSAGTLNPYYGAIDQPDNRSREIQFTLKARF
jgi:hypothetical protein